MPRLSKKQKQEWDFFVNPKTETLIHRSGGNKPAADFIADAEGALDPKLSSVYLTEKYKSGKYDGDFLIDYIHRQKVSGNRNVQKDFDKLIEMGGKLTDPKIWELYVECIGGYNNPYVKEGPIIMMNSSVCSERRLWMRN